MPRWGKVSIATVLPLAAGAPAWWVCAVTGVDPNASGTVVSLVVLVPGTPLVIWAGQAALAHYERAEDRLEAVLGSDQPWALTAARDLARARRLAASG
ncbi:hypothetical protein [Spirillospora sp. CA-128828]|uniref:hypothetical protein n=1 Tax=Spirillospora sp. CA-128828 TaxID=3240033 RepID=UPI003D8F1141